MRKIASVILIICAAFGAIACQSAQANNTAQRRAIALPAERNAAISEIVKAAEAVGADAKESLEKFKAKLTDEQKKLIEEYTAISTQEQRQYQGLQNLLNQHATEARLAAVKAGNIPAPDVDKFALYKRADGSWELADSAPPPAPPR